VGFGQFDVLRGGTDIAERDKRVSAQEARFLPRDEEPVVGRDEVVAVRLEPVAKRNMRLGVVRERVAGAPALDTAVPRTHVLADVAAVDLDAELGAVFLRNRRARLRPVREAAVGVERSRTVEGAGGA